MITAEYFFDTCTLWELDDLLEYIPYLDRNMWESARLNAYITAQVNSRKRLQMTDICKFKWEEEDDDEKVIEIEDKDIERLKLLAKKWED